ncbi:hypothetical protein NLG97_g1353 [Lecanicillium saksenae]|uniref:Uncharacterized protein n=1 Tax=Lecanicillium saksenae TaxID=468837 RepID=A0ACC1R6M8_9HYPO|nr:hypothetical protein NLG97_g1353 [Lecanicillium saksenae]
MITMTLCQVTNTAKNWSLRRKAVHFGVVLLFVAISFASTDSTIIYHDLAKRDLQLGDQGIAAASALRFVGLAVAGIILVPLAYRYGRRPVYILSVTVQLASVVWTATARHGWEFIMASGMAGVGASVSQAIVPLTITDIFFMNKFATAYGWYVFAQGAGAFLGPLLASFIVAGQGWRMMTWWMALTLLIIAFIVLLLLEESTFVPNIDVQMDCKKAQAKIDRRMAFGNEDFANERQQEKVDAFESNMPYLASGLGLPPAPKSLRQRLATITPTGRPIGERFMSCFVILVRFPGVAYAALTYGFIMIWLELFNYAIITEMTVGPYNFDIHDTGLFNLAPLLGLLVGTLAITPLSDRWMVKRAIGNAGLYEPETRLWLALPAGALVAAGALMFGIGISQKASIPILSNGFLLFSVGFGLCLETSLTYVTECYHSMIGDAFVGVVFVRNISAAILWAGIMPWLNTAGNIRSIVIITGAGLVAVLLIPVALLRWGRTGRMATAAKYRHYSLAATPPAILERIFGNKADR